MVELGPFDDDDEVGDLEIELLLEGVHRRYGLDFRDYAKSTLRRRIRARVLAEELPNTAALQGRVLRDVDCLDRLVKSLSVHVTAMFRDPEFYLALREKVVPHLRTYPFLRIWHAGCSTGEEVYSLAILLCEVGLYERSRLYATDISDEALARARSGVFSLEGMRENTRNYVKAGGQGAFSDYYSSDDAGAKFSQKLRKNLVFARHNLVTDGSFNEFHLILCRNVIIYFSTPLQERVHSLLIDSLPVLGFLGLGLKESLHPSSLEQFTDGCAPNAVLLSQDGHGCTARVGPCDGFRLIRSQPTTTLWHFSSSER